MPAFAALARPSQRVAVGHYGALAPGLFETVLVASTRVQPHRDTSHGNSRTEPTGPAQPVTAKAKATATVKAAVTVTATAARATPMAMR